MPVDAGTPRAEIDELAARFHASVIAVTSEVAAKHYPGAQALDDQLAVVRREDSLPPSHHTQGAAVFKVTSGSTALPKAVIVTDAQIIEDTDHIVEAMGIRPADTQVAVIPLSHAYGFGNLIMPMLLNGTPIVLRESFVPQLLPSDARRFAARVFHGVPFMFQYFVTNPPADGWPDCLQWLISAGAPLESETVKGFHDLFGVKIHSFYGTSEAGGICFDTERWRRRQADRRLAAAGCDGHAATGRRHSRRVRPGPRPQFGGRTGVRRRDRDERRLHRRRLPHGRLRLVPAGRTSCAGRPDIGLYQRRGAQGPSRRGGARPPIDRRSHRCAGDRRRRLPCAASRSRRSWPAAGDSPRPTSGDTVRAGSRPTRFPASSSSWTPCRSPRAERRIIARSRPWWRHTGA